MLTRGGVCYDLDVSPYKVEVVYNELYSVNYIFSSKLYTSIFKRKIESNRQTLKKSLSKRFKLDVSYDVLADVILYSKVEKRGFLIRGRKEYRCQKSIQLNGINKI